MSDASTEISLPLLARELTELAARRRTYLIRVLYAAALLFSGWLAFQLSTMHRSTRAIDYLGSGAVLLWWTAYLQNIGLLIVLPALTCDVFTREKERQTLSLLFLTRLTSSTIVLEKFLSRLFPAVCLLLISMPLLAFSYSLGGVESWQVTNAALGLMTNAIVLTAIAVACSSFCHSTLSAFMWTYALIMVTPLMVIVNRGAVYPFDFILFGNYVGRALLLNVPQLSFRFGGILPGATDVPWMMCLKYLAGCLPSLGFAVLYLALARWFLVSRASKKPSAPFRGWNVLRRITGSSSRQMISAESIPPVIDDSESLDMQPVAWRETHKCWASRAFLNRTLLVLLFLLVSFAAWRTRFSGYVPGSQPWFINAASLGLWATMLFVLTAATANLIAQERGQQTLVVLLTTPMSGSEIVRQKLAGIQRLMWTFLIPMAYCLIIRMLIATPRVQRRSAGSVDYPMAFINECTMLWIYPHMIIWMAFYYSLKSKTTIAAIMKTILTIAAQCVLPWLMLMLYALVFGGFNQNTFFLIMLLLMIGPADLLLYGYSTDCIPPGFDESLVPVIVNTIIHGLIWCGLRYKCLDEADRLLGRR